MPVSGLEEFHDSMRRKNDLLTIFRKVAASMQALTIVPRLSSMAGMKRQGLTHT